MASEHSAGEAESLPMRNQRVAFTGEGRHWHGTVVSMLTGFDGRPRVRVDVDPGYYSISSVVYRLGEHFRLTAEGDPCPDCDKPDCGLPMYSRL
jgi:hypothetical protein